MKYPAIYKIQSKKFPNRCYVGSANNVKNRWSNHIGILRKGKHHSIKLQNHYNKYSESDLVFIIIEPCLPEFLIEREQYYLDKEKPYFNICKIAGSCKGIIASDETKRKMSEARKGHFGWNKGKKGMFKHTEQHKKRMSLLKTGVPRSEETKMKVSKSLKGKMAGDKNPFYGKKLTEEHKKKLSDSHKGKQPYNKGKRGLMKHTEEWKKRHSEAMMGEKNPLYGVGHTEEAKAKMRAYKRTDEHTKHLAESLKGKFAGEKNPFYGKRHSEECRERMRIAQRKRFQREKELKLQSLNLIQEAEELDTMKTTKSLSEILTKC
jgi:hypothetical protein